MPRASFLVLVSSCKFSCASFFVQVGSCRLGCAGFLVQVGSCKCGCAGFLVQVGSCKFGCTGFLVQVGWCKCGCTGFLVQVGSRKFGCTGFLVQVGSCKCGCASFLVQVGSCKFWLRWLSHASWLVQVWLCELSRAQLTRRRVCDFSCKLDGDFTRRPLQCLQEKINGPHGVIEPLEQLQSTIVCETDGECNRTHSHRSGLPFLNAAPHLPTTQ